MGRKSKREVERKLDELDGGSEATVEEIIMLDLRLAHDANLSPNDRQLLSALERGEVAVSSEHQALLDEIQEAHADSTLQN